MNSVKIKKAKDYPYKREAQSFIYYDGKAYNLSENIDLGLKQFIYDKKLNKFSLNDRTPVLAYGSNATVFQLGNKFKDLKDCVIPVVNCIINDYDVVYTAKICSYGAIPATLRKSQGSRAEIAITYLTEEQLKIMHKSETKGIAYDFVELEDVSYEINNEVIKKNIYTYLSYSGCLSINNEAIALSAINNKTRSLKSLYELDILKHLCEKFSDDKNLDNFILANISSKTERATINKKLKKTVDEESLFPIEILTRKGKYAEDGK